MQKPNGGKLVRKNIIPFSSFCDKDIAADEDPLPNTVHKNKKTNDVDCLEPVEGSEEDLELVRIQSPDAASPEDSEIQSLELDRYLLRANTAESSRSSNKSPRSFYSLSLGLSQSNVSSHRPPRRSRYPDSQEIPNHPTTPHPHNASILRRGRSDPVACRTATPGPLSTPFPPLSPRRSRLSSPAIEALSSTPDETLPSELQFLMEFEFEEEEKSESDSLPYHPLDLDLKKDELEEVTQT